MLKQPNEYKMDYKNGKNIAENIMAYVSNEPYEKDGKTVRRPISFEYEKEQFKEDAIEQLGILKEDFNNVRTIKSKEKNSIVQKGIKDAIKELNQKIKLLVKILFKLNIIKRISEDWFDIL